MLHRLPIWLFPLLALALTAISAIIWQQPATNHITIAPLAQNCNLHIESCSSQIDKHEVRLDITPKPVPIAKALTINATLADLPATQVQLDINGSNMYMGYNRITLTQQDKGQWNGKSLLAFCTTDEMHWQLTLMIDLIDGRQLQIPFPLTTPYRLE
jgi:hypothetical protein